MQADTGEEVPVSFSASSLDAAGKPSIIRKKSSTGEATMTSADKYETPVNPELWQHVLRNCRWFPMDAMVLHCSLRLIYCRPRTMVAYHGVHAPDFHKATWDGRVSNTST